MRHAVGIAVLAGALLLAGCANRAGVCPPAGAYADARPRTPYTVPDDLERPSEAARLRVPEGSGTVPAGLRGTAYDAHDGSVRCLDQPPPMRRDVLRAL